MSFKANMLEPTNYYNTMFQVLQGVPLFFCRNMNMIPVSLDNAQINSDVVPKCLRNVSLLCFICTKKLKNIWTKVDPLGSCYFCVNMV